LLKRKPVSLETYGFFVAHILKKAFKET